MYRILDWVDLLINSSPEKIDHSNAIVSGGMLGRNDFGRDDPELDAQIKIKRL